MIVQSTFRLRYATRKRCASSSDVSSGVSFSQLAPAHMLLRDPLLVYSVFPANGSGPEFSTSFAALDREGLLGKVVLMRDLLREPSPDLRLFGVLSLDSHGIFMTERLAPVARRPPSLVPVPLSTSGTVTTHGGLISPQTSESQFSATNNGFKPIDASKVRDVHHQFGYRSCRNVCGIHSPFSCMLICFPDLQPLHKRESGVQFPSVLGGEADLWRWADVQRPLRHATSFI